MQINFDFKDINFSVKVRDIHKIERKNPIGINLFGYKDKKKYPVYVSKNDARINMLINY